MKVLARPDARRNRRREPFRQDVVPGGLVLGLLAFPIDGRPNVDRQIVVMQRVGQVGGVVARRDDVATNGGGLNLFDGATRKTYDTSNSALPSNYLTSIAIDKQNRVWVGTFGAGVARLDGEQWTRVGVSLANNYINALALDANGNPWVATNDGAFFYDGKTLAPSGAEGSPTSSGLRCVTIHGPIGQKVSKPLARDH